jgi:hypothetical protein
MDPQLLNHQEIQLITRKKLGSIGYSLTEDGEAMARRYAKKILAETHSTIDRADPVDLFVLSLLAGALTPESDDLAIEPVESIHDVTRRRLGYIGYSIKTKNGREEAKRNRKKNTAKLLREIGQLADEDLLIVRLIVLDLLT